MIIYCSLSLFYCSLSHELLLLRAGNSSAQNKNTKQKKKSKDSSLIADHGFGEGFATMRHAPSAPIQPLRQRSLIADHGFGEGFATITAAPSAPPIKPSSHQPTLSTFLSSASIQAEGRDIISQRFLEQLPLDAEPTVIRGASATVDIERITMMLSNP